MKAWMIFLTLALALSACGPAPATGKHKISGCREMLDAMTGLLSPYGFPDYFQQENPLKQGGEFDVMSYFEVLDHLSLEPGYVLDYVYHFDGMGGYPFIYARLADQPAYATEAELNLHQDVASEWLNYVRVDDTPESYFQYLALALYGSQFYLFWHAGYDDSRVVCDRSDVHRITEDQSFGLAMPLQVQARAALLHDLEPVVTLGAQTVEVQMITFTKWGGFYLETYTLQRGAGTRILDSKSKNIIHYDCGILF
jgi:hypothetical protein